MSRKRWSAALAACLVTAVLAIPTAAHASADFFTYDGDQPLSSFAPGTVLKTRTVNYPLEGMPFPIAVVQLLFRSADATGRPTAAVTSVLQPIGVPLGKVVSYQSYYDALDPKGGPAYSFASGVPDGTSAEVASIVPLLLQGYAVNFPDTEGPTADFALGPEYAQVTLDSLRAASASPASGVGRTSPIALMGYSGGAIATNWTAALAASYAPEIGKRVIGAAEGGILVEPGHNLHYIDGTAVWGGVEAMAIIGVGRGYHIDFSPYLSDYGKAVEAKMDKAQIYQVLGQYPGLAWSQLTTPQYPTPESVPLFVDYANKLNLGTQPIPTVPMMMGQGVGGEAEGTPGNKPGIGAGDAVMIAGDVRALAHRYCDAGLQIQYTEYPTSHVPGIAPWLGQALPWVTARFAGETPPNNCSSIAAGNSLAPIEHSKRVTLSQPGSALPLPIPSTPSNPLSDLLNKPLAPGIVPSSALNSLVGLATSGLPTGR